MIRPFTLICMASAFGAGLYLYQSKHQAQMLDREITRALKQTETVRERTGMLRAEWALLNEPDRLADLAKAHLALQTLKPTQFVSMGDLTSRLPAPAVPRLERLPREAEPEEAVPVAQAAPVVVKPREMASVAEPKAKPDVRPDPKPEPKPAVVAEAKPVVRAVEKPVSEKPVQDKPVLARAEPAHAGELATSVHARNLAPAPVVANNDATAPGTVGAAVLRAMRAQNGGGGAAAPRTYVPTATMQQAYSPPSYAQPAYAQPAYAQPAYAPAYAAPGMSVLGGHPALPPPVPFAAR